MTASEHENMDAVGREEELPHSLFHLVVSSIAAKQIISTWWLAPNDVFYEFDLKDYFITGSHGFLIFRA